MTQQCRLESFFCSTVEVLSLGALPADARTRPIDPSSPAPWNARTNFFDRNRIARPVSSTVPAGFRRFTASLGDPTASEGLFRSPIDLAMIRREHASLTAQG